MLRVKLLCPLATSVEYARTISLSTYKLRLAVVKWFVLTTLFIYGLIPVTLITVILKLWGAI